MPGIYRNDCATSNPNGTCVSTQLPFNFAAQIADVLTLLSRTVWQRHRGWQSYIRQRVFRGVLPSRVHHVHGSAADSRSKPCAEPRAARYQSSTDAAWQCAYDRQLRRTSSSAYEANRLCVAHYWCRFWRVSVEEALRGFRSCGRWRDHVANERMNGTCDTSYHDSYSIPSYHDTLRSLRSWLLVGSHLDRIRTMLYGPVRTTLSFPLLICVKLSTDCSQDRSPS